MARLLEMERGAGGQEKPEKNGIIKNQISDRLKRAAVRCISIPLDMPEFNSIQKMPSFLNGPRKGKNHV